MTKEDFHERLELDWGRQRHNEVSGCLSNQASTQASKGGGQAYLRDAAIDHFGVLESWCTEKLFSLWTVIEVHSVKCELPKSWIVYTYIADQFKKKNL